MIFTTLRKGPLRVAVIGGGNWGTAVATLVAKNAGSSYLFDKKVTIWAMEDEVKKSINEEHENKKFLPGIKLPENLVCSSDLQEVSASADLLVIVVPHQFLIRTLDIMKPHVHSSARAITLVKGLHIDQTDGPRPKTFSSVIEESLGIPCSCLSGANVAKDVALKQFSESTIGFKAENSDVIPLWQQLFDTPDFKVRCIPDQDGVEIYGAVKNLVAIAAGFCDGLGLGTNAKSAIMRIGANEIRLFCAVFFPTATTQAFFESCGFADLITTCFGGRNVKCAAEFARRGGLLGGATWKSIEDEFLGGQFLQGTHCTKEVAEILTHHQIFEYFPLFKATYDVSFNVLPVSHIIDVFRCEGPIAGSILDAHSTDKDVMSIPPGLLEKIRKTDLYLDHIKQA